MSHRLTSAAVVVAAALLAGGIASADFSKTVTASLKGQIIVSKGELPEGKSDKDTVAKIKAAKLTEVIGEVQEDVAYWRFHYTAFLKATGSTTLKMEFYRDGKQYAADKSLEGVDPKSPILVGDISINEDEGLAKGKHYTIKLVNPKNVVVSTTQLHFK
jgi:hypothetical protein